MKNYYRIMLGKKSVYVEECFKGNFIGAGFDIAIVNRVKSLQLSG
jgi:restriction system protein